MNGFQRRSTLSATSAKVWFEADRPQLPMEEAGLNSSWAPQSTRESSWILKSSLVSCWMTVSIMKLSKLYQERTQYSSQIIALLIPSEAFHLCQEHSTAESSTGSGNGPPLGHPTPRPRLCLRQLVWFSAWVQAAEQKQTHSRNFSSFYLWGMDSHR